LQPSEFGPTKPRATVFNYLLQRLATIVPTLFFVSILIFGLQQLLPGDRH
jgi:ABC-type dipeptide/oligopeptide/nickel transport system permease component